MAALLLLPSARLLGNIAMARQKNKMFSNALNMELLRFDDLCLDETVTGSHRALALMARKLIDAALDDETALKDRLEIIKYIWARMEGAVPQEINAQIDHTVTKRDERMRRIAELQAKVIEATDYTEH